MEEYRSTSVAQREDTIDLNNKYRTLVEKLILLELSVWPKFQEHLKKRHLAELYQVRTQQVKNRKKKTQGSSLHQKIHARPTTPTQTPSPKSAKSPPTNKRLHKSPIHPLKTVKDKLKTFKLDYHDRKIRQTLA